MKRWLFFFYGVGCHLLFLGTFAYMAGFVGNFLVPRTMDTMGNESIAAAAGTDLLLLGVFAVQHSVMARPSFKRIWMRVMPQAIERSTYVLTSCLVTFLLMWQWRGIGPVIWDVRDPVWRMVIWSEFTVGWLMVPLVSLMIDHFDLFGTRQVWLHLRGREYEALPFRTPMLYNRIRHPLYVGWAIAFWATPTMTTGHLLFAVVLTAYMVVAVFFEERNLVDHFGPAYEDYRQRVPKFIPRWNPANSTSIRPVRGFDSVKQSISTASK